MTYQDSNNCDNRLYDGLKIDCSKCFGFCCVALYFSASEGFPNDKEAGKPCINLQQDFNCAVHKSLREKGLKGCTAYDCFGAGQKTAQITYAGRDWRAHQQLASQMFETFLVMRQLHEMLWYLAEAFRMQPSDTLKEKLSQMIYETEQLTMLEAEALNELDTEAHRQKVNTLLQQTSELLRSKALKGEKNTLKRKKTIAGRLNLIGANLRKENLKGADLRGALLIAADLRGMDLRGADFIGADLRDADLRGADLSGSLFMTQSQINTAKGDSHTKLPVFLTRPNYWEK